MTSTTTLPCAGCTCYLGDVLQPLVVNFDGFRYCVCAYGCASRLLARLTASSMTTTPAISDTPEQLIALDSPEKP